MPKKDISNKDREATIIIKMYMLSKCCNSFQWNGLTGEQLFFTMVHKLPMLLIMQLLFCLMYNVVCIKQKLKKDKKKYCYLNTGNYSLHQLNALSNDHCVYRIQHLVQFN